MTARFAAMCSVAFVALFWMCALLAGALAPGYSARDDYISSLAGRGSSVAILGLIGLTALGLAHLAAAAALRGTVAIPLFAAGLAGLTVAAFRTNCPDGAGGCGSATNDAPADLADQVHGMAVVAYEIAIVAAMLVIAVGLFRTRASVAALNIVVAVASVLLALQIGGSDSGWWQRAWLVVNTGWLVVLILCRTTTAQPPRHRTTSATVAQ